MSRSLGTTFQSPSHRGVNYCSSRMTRASRGRCFSPLRIGESITACSLCHHRVSDHSFSPLRIGESITAVPIQDRTSATSGFSPLRIGESITAPSNLRVFAPAGLRFSPLRIGESITADVVPRCDLFNRCFSPLRIGESITAQQRVDFIPRRIGKFQSPSHRGVNYCRWARQAVSQAA